jgi:hypothetical protein
LSAPYPGLDTVNASNDVTKILIYANDLTGGVLGPMILGAFFLIVLLAGYFYQIRTTGRGRFDVSFAVAGFTSFGFSLIMSLENGLLQPTYMFVTLGIAVISALWLYFNEPSPY